MLMILLMGHPESLTIQTLDRPVDASLNLPGSKSLSNRALLLAAMARGTSKLERLLFADDTELMIECLNRLGVSIEADRRTERAVIHGVGGQWPEVEADLYCGNAGTVIRFLTAACAAGAGEFTLDGNPRMRERPVGELVESLIDLGATIGYGGVDGYCPLNVHGRGLRGGSIRMGDLVSSQTVSAVLMAAPRAVLDVMVELEGQIASEPYIAMTLAVMEAFGVGVIHEEMRRFIVPESQQYKACQYAIEPDASSASYFFAAAALSGGRVTVMGLGNASCQGDIRFVRVLQQMGCQVVQAAGETTIRGPGAGHLQGVDVDLNDMPDMVPTLAVLAAFAAGPSRIRNVGHLRFKESDRLAAVSTELNKLGAEAEVVGDRLEVRPSGVMRGATIETYDDHRIAMSFALAGLMIPGVTIMNPGCVAKSMPTFFEYLGKLRVRTE